MKKVFFLIVLTSQLYSQNSSVENRNGVHLFIGDALSQFQSSLNDKSHSILYGIGFEYFVYNNYSFGLDLSYTNYQGSYNSKIIGSYWIFGDFVDSWSLYNFKTSYSVIEIPLSINYKYPIFKSFSIQVHGGYSISFFSDEKTKYIKIRELTSEENGYQNHDYRWEEDPNPEETFIVTSYFLGFGFYYKDFFLKTRIVKNIENGPDIKRLHNFKEKLESFKIYFGMKL
ncbi:MAG: hypothetical protein HND50_00015 [Calditrichaeota bacterium]|nr:hypothetical protein [Calditrichota bacterium]